MNHSKQKMHWSFWVIATIALVYNLMGCFNFIWQMNPDAVAAMPEAYRSVVETRPVWATGVFALAVFGGAIGSLLLLMRMPMASYVFMAATVGGVLSLVPLFAAAVIPSSALAGALVQTGVTAFLIAYSLRVLKRS